MGEMPVKTIRPARIPRRQDRRRMLEFTRPAIAFVDGLSLKQPARDAEACGRGCARSEDLPVLRHVDGAGVQTFHVRVIPNALDALRDGVTSGNTFRVGIREVKAGGTLEGMLRVLEELPPQGRAEGRQISIHVILARRERTEKEHTAAALHKSCQRSTDAAPSPVLFAGRSSIAMIR